MALLGGGLAALALVHAARFAGLDQAMPAAGPQVGLLRGLAMFAPLPMAPTELLAAGLQPRQFPAGAVVIRGGEPGDHLYLIVEGSAAVTVRGAPRPTLHAGDCFGEIALLRDLPRTATITAEQPLHTLALGREEFLTAVTGNSSSSAAADTLAGGLTGAAQRHANWHEPTAEETAAAVAELWEIAGDRGDLLAEVAGILLGFDAGTINEPNARTAAGFCVAAGADEALVPAVGRGRTAP